MTRRNRKIRKYKKPVHLNIGLIIFSIIFIYIIISVTLYFFSKHISVYEVNKGKLATNYKYHGFAIKEENIVTAQDSGNITYYARECEKVGCSSFIYSINSTGNLSDLLKSTDGNSDILDKKELTEIHKSITDFSYTFNKMDFTDVYDFKYDIEESLISSINLNALEKMNENDSNLNMQTYKAPAAGMILFSTDGYENVSQDNFQYSYLNDTNYRKINHKSNTVKAGDIIYKLVSSENWNLIIEIDEALAKKLEDTENIEVKFLKDDSTTWAGFNIFEKDGKKLAKLSFTNSLVRFASERYIDVELQINDDEGLKIPASSITKKEFYIIPSDYVTHGGNSKKPGFIVEKLDEEQKSAVKFTPTTLYYSDDKVCYVDTSCFNTGDTIIKPDSNERYQLGKKESLIGVYNINKGYAMFKRIEILYQNEEYCIIKSGTDYGLALYDHIALDSDSINEDDIIQ
ncbi:HlyD family efflux transporter periplasmic adaptor subunit [Anaerosacchariphilus polymeriproducens]|uniref:RND related barrel-sandwich hybrid domain-containing protein n=1 Tax=Anaerosacchariphilus polymeriproducens TaxID=1812858 RepID=A0A371AU16_9FIRM|nr:HlyD family efflux transporter periplasmic adaptor subunit [Anaerosacchariphilus polymeriproducens]RDU23053.1 hypothetical protein DWV06_11870 [Anaerosacchariphilus polymeriproducens]